MNTKGASCKTNYKEGSTYKSQLNTTKIDFYDDRFEIQTVFNKKGKYLVEIFGNNFRGNSYTEVSEYAVEVENDSKQKLSFPFFYEGKEDINVIQPQFNNLKFGQKVKFKVKSKYENLVVIDGEWHKMVKKEDGFFEVEVIIKTKKGSEVSIVRMTSRS